MTSHSSDSAPSPVAEKSDATVEDVHTNERISGHNYYEKNGLRTYGDDADHDHEPPVRIPNTWKSECSSSLRLPSLVSCPWWQWHFYGLALKSPSISSVCDRVPSAVLFGGKQLVRSGEIDQRNRCGPSVYLWRHWRRRSLDMVCRWNRRPNGHHGRADPDQVLGNLLALAAVCPFVGSLSDLIGRRYVALSGAMFIILGMVISSTAHSMNVFICRRPSPIRLTPDEG